MACLEHVQAVLLNVTRKLQENCALLFENRKWLLEGIQSRKYGSTENKIGDP